METGTIHKYVYSTNPGLGTRALSQPTYRIAPFRILGEMQAPLSPIVLKNQGKVSEQLVPR